MTMTRVLQVKSVLHEPANACWRAWVYDVKNGGCVEHFDRATCSEAHDAAQAFCDRENAKAAKPKPPEGFVMATGSSCPIPCDADGNAIAIDGNGCFVVRWTGNPLPSDHRYILPAAPKGLEEENTRLQREVNRLREDQRLIHEQLQKEPAASKRETREEAEKRGAAYIKFRGWSNDFHYGRIHAAFLAGAGFVE